MIRFIFPTHYYLLWYIYFTLESKNRILRSLYCLNCCCIILCKKATSTWMVGSYGDCCVLYNLIEFYNKMKDLFIWRHWDRVDFCHPLNIFKHIDYYIVGVSVPFTTDFINYPHRVVFEIRPQVLFYFQYVLFIHLFKKLAKRINFCYTILCGRRHSYPLN